MRLIFHVARAHWLLPMNGNRGINSSPNPKNSPDYPFKAVPEPHSVHQRIHDIGEHAVMTVLGVGMVTGVMTWGLDQPDALEP